MMTVAVHLDKEKLMTQGRKGRFAQARSLNEKGGLAFDKSMNSSSMGIDKSQDVGAETSRSQTWAALVCPTLLVKYEAKSEGEGGIGGLSRKEETK